MLCPDVWKFVPTSNVTEYKRGKSNNKSTKYLENLIEQHPFNKMISIFLPDKNTVPDDILDLVKRSDHYSVRKFQLVDLIRKEFVEGFVKRGRFTAILVDTYYDVDDSYAVSPNGKLILTVNKDLYQSLGLEGHPILQSRSSFDSRYVVEIDLKHCDLTDGRKYFERVKMALTRASSELTQSMKFFWDSPQDDICPSSVAKYFSELGYEVELDCTRMKVNHQFGLKIPKMTPPFTDDDADLPHELVEYVSMNMLSCDTGMSDGLSSYQPRLPHEQFGFATVLHCKGLFSGKFLIDMLSKIRRIVNLKANNPWIAICVNGFQFCPIGFYSKGHQASFNGDNHYIIFLYPNDYHFIYKTMSIN